MPSPSLVSLCQCMSEPAIKFIASLFSILLNVVDYLKVMSFTLNSSKELRTLNSTPSTYKMSPTFQQNLTMAFYLISHPCANQHGIWVKCRVWTRSMVAMLVARWKWSTLKMIWIMFSK
jgi:hypothetical protein